MKENRGLNERTVTAKAKFQSKKSVVNYDSTVFIFLGLLAAWRILYVLGELSEIKCTQACMPAPALASWEAAMSRQLSAAKMSR